ncbi:MAG: hypothetical protein ABH914_02165, partial [Candidatus Omnitrophota bacterium]
MHIWLPEYILQRIKRLFRLFTKGEKLHIMFCFVDHFEPQWNKAALYDEVNRVDTWTEGYPKLARRHKDSDGYYPRYTFFYPIEEYRAEHLEKLACLCREGLAEVEIHLHHDNDTAQGLKQKLKEAKALFNSHGLLAKHRNTGKIYFGFIHGNWALDNSRSDGRWCGVNNELSV